MQQTRLNEKQVFFFFQYINYITPLPLRFLMRNLLVILRIPCMWWVSSLLLFSKVFGFQVWLQCVLVWSLWFHLSWNLLFFLDVWSLLFFMSFINLGKFSANLFANNLSVPFSFSSFWDSQDVYVGTFYGIQHLP